MIRILIATVGLVGLIGATPVLAQTTDQATHPISCQDAITKDDAIIAASTDATKRAVAMKEEDQAKGMLANRDEASCMMHMNNAMGAMK
jgi:hypothetical protein